MDCTDLKYDFIHDTIRESSTISVSFKKLSIGYVKVLQDGMKVEIPTRELVTGDILILEAGDIVGGDGRILESYSLQVNESSLTGEAVPVDKKEGTIENKTELANLYNMVYSSTFVTNGTATGMDTEIGKIAQMMNEIKEKKTPLQIRLDRFSKNLAIGIIGICILVFI